MFRLFQVHSNSSDLFCSLLLCTAMPSAMWVGGVLAAAASFALPSLPSTVTSHESSFCSMRRVIMIYT